MKQTNIINIPTHDEDGEPLASIWDLKAILAHHCRYKPKAGGLYLHEVKDGEDTLYTRLAGLLKDQSVGGGLTKVALKTKTGKTRKNNVLCTKNQLFEILCKMHPRWASSKAVIICPDPISAVEACDHLFGKSRTLNVTPHTGGKPRPSPANEEIETEVHTFVPGITSKTIFEFSYPGVPTPEMTVIFHQVEELMVKFEFIKAGELEGGKAA